MGNKYVQTTLIGRIVPVVL